MRCAPALVLLLAGLVMMPDRGRAEPMPATEAAHEAGWELGAGLDWNRRYVWRGIAFSEGGVWNPSLAVGRGPVSLDLWANLDPAAERPFNEWDATLGAGFEWAGLAISPALAVYAYPGGTPATGELLLEVAHTRGALTTTLRHAVDVVAEPLAAWSEVGFGGERELRPGVTAAGGVRFGRGWWRFASAYADPALEGLNVLGAHAELSLGLRGGWTLRPHLEWNQVGNRLVRGDLTGPSPWGGGLALEWER